MRMRKVWAIGLLLISCADESKTDALGRYRQRLRECGIVSKDGKIADQPELSELVGVCFQKCVLGAGCDELKLAWCEEEVPARLAECLEACDPPFQCRDGSTDDAYRCDGWEDCADASDEDGCPASAHYVCEDGERFPLEFACDGEPDCDDGSDESDCAGAPLFSCGDGQKVPDEYECDGEEDCLNGSDERSCEGRVFECGDGQMLPIGAVCDLFKDCEDGSDEAQGCAQLTCGP
jgi:very low-density lipoprotein receptor